MFFHLVNIDIMFYTFFCTKSRKRYTAMSRKKVKLASLERPWYCFGIPTQTLPAEFRNPYVVFNYEPEDSQTKLAFFEENIADFCK